MNQEEIEKLIMTDNWQPTAQLRYIKRIIVTVPSGIDPSFFIPQRISVEREFLQQLWSDGFGKTEWRDVEVVSE